MLEPTLSTDPVLTETRDGVVRITLNRPQAGNRFTYAMMQAFIAALDDAQTSGAALLVLDAAGDDFTLGRDQSERLPDVSRAQSLGLILRANALLGGFEGVSVALVRGRAMGFGTGLALHADITLADADAVFGFDEIRHGLAPLVVVGYLADHVGRKAAMELVSTGRDVPAAEALTLGLVNRVIAGGGLRAAGEELVEALSAYEPSALRLIARFRNELATGDVAEPGPLAVERLSAWLEAGKP